MWMWEQWSLFPSLPPISWVTWRKSLISLGLRLLVLMTSNDSHHTFDGCVNIGLRIDRARKFHLRIFYTSVTDLWGKVFCQVISVSWLPTSSRCTTKSLSVRDLLIDLQEWFKWFAKNRNCIQSAQSPQSVTQDQEI